MKKLALTLALFTFVAIGTASIQSVIASTTGIEMVRQDDDKKKEETKKKSECSSKKKCCSESKSDKCDDKKSDEKKSDEKK